MFSKLGLKGQIDFWIRSLMFDESTFDLSLQHEAATSTSVLCSRGYWTYRSAERCGGGTHFPTSAGIVPQYECFFNVECSFERAGWFPRTLFCQVSVHSDHLRRSRCQCAFATVSGPVIAAGTTFFLPVLCVQHRTGNVIEQLSKLSGVFWAEIFQWQKH